MKNKWKNIKLVISDFDGVMTDNRVLIDQYGNESVFVSRADGQGIKILRELEIEVVIISSEKNEVVLRRAEKLDIECINDVKNKKECLLQFLKRKKISKEKVLYIGNDINDFDAMQLAALRVVPQDAYDEVKSIADYITDSVGGYGVIRELADIIKKERSEENG